MTPRLGWLSWHLDEDGGGEAVVAIDHGSSVDEQKYVFESLDSPDQIPRGIAEMIRKDGRKSGRIDGTYTQS